MSETELWIGKAHLITRNHITDEEHYKSICQEAGYTKEDYHNSWQEALQDKGHEKYVITSNGVWRIHDGAKKDALDDILEMRHNEDGTCDFILQFHNGGFSFDDAFLTALEKAGGRDDTGSDK